MDSSEGTQYIFRDIMKTLNSIFGNKKIWILFSGLFLYGLSCSANVVSPTGNRQWDDISSLDEVMITVESKVCALVLDIESMSDLNTFTIIDFIQDKWCSIDSKLDEVNLLLSAIDMNIQTFDVKVDIIDNEIVSSIEELSVIRGDDFGGTWTAIDAVESVLCDKALSLLVDLSTVEEKIDLISGAQLAAFYGTCTVIESISDNVAINMSLICSLAVEVASDVDSITSLLDMLEDQNNTIESKLDELDLKFETNFDGTFTALAAVQSKVCLVESQFEAIIDFSCTDTPIDIYLDKACTIDSKVDVLEGSIRSLCDGFITIESYFDGIDGKFASSTDGIGTMVDTITYLDTTLYSITEIIQTIESTIDAFNPALSKLCVLDSKIDLTVNVWETIESTVDINQIFVQTLISKVDILEVEVVGSSVDKACAIESSLDVITSSIDEAIVNMETFVTLESRVDELLKVTELALVKACDSDSIIDIVITSLNSFSDSIITVGSTVDAACTTIQTIESKIDLTQKTVITFESYVDILDATIETLLSKVCTIDSKVDVTDMMAETVQSKIDIIQVEMCSFVDDFQGTWTILETIQRKVCTADSVADVVESKIEDRFGEIPGGPDLDGTYTALDALFPKLCSIESILDVTSKIFDLSEEIGTFTMLEAILGKVCTTDSKVDAVSETLISEESNLVLALGCLGTEITADDIGTTGYTITEPGRYILSGNVDFSPTGAATAITIDSDNVTLDLCNMTLRQANAPTAYTVNGVAINASRKNIAIQNGTIRTMEGDGILVGDGAVNISLEDLFLIDEEDDGIDCVGTVTGLMVNRVLATACSNRGIELAEGSEIVIINSIISNNQGGGIYIEPITGTAERICILSSLIGSNLSHGIHIIGTSGTVSQVVIDDCIVSSQAGGGDGIRFNQVIDSSIKGCFCSSNAGDGIELTGACNDVELLGNICGSSTAQRGIYMSSSSLEDCSIQNNVLIFNAAGNYSEATSAGPHSVFSNFALNSIGALNYIANGTTINSTSVQEDGMAAITAIGKWRNISMTPA